VSTLRTQLWLIRLLILLAAVLLGLGLVAPCMTITPGFGQFDGWVKLLKPELSKTTTYSLLSGIVAMIHHGSVGVGLLLLAFSVIFPATKLAVMAWGTQMLTTREPPGFLLRLAHHTGRFSMLDVMVVALIVIAIKGLPGNTNITIGWGVFAFAGSVVMSIIISAMLHRLTKGPRDRHLNPEP
jgi:paraquat-inducible protein A